MSWNVVLNKFCEIKKKAVEQGIDLWKYDTLTETCLEYWVRMLCIPEYEELIRYLRMNEWQDFLLIRYGDYSDLFHGTSEVSFDSFWDIQDGFYRECRSLVIDIRKDALVLTPFKKFRNLDEGEETSCENVRKRIDQAKCVEVSDKLDGSMQTARFYEGEIRMAGSQSLDREASWRLEDGYRMLMADIGYQNMIKEHADKTFIFEYLSQKDVHVVNYDKEGLFLIGIRDVNTGEESSYKEVLAYAKTYGIPATEVFDKTLDEILAELDEKKSSEAEGFVVNIDGFKVKIKYNDYVTMHRMLSAMSSINLVIQNIAQGSFDDMLAKVPAAYRERVEKVARHVFAYKGRIEAETDRAFEQAPKKDKKEFMIWVQNHVPRELQGFVRNKYLGLPYNVLKKSNRYLKLREMGVEDYGEVFRNEE